MVNWRGTPPQLNLLNKPKGGWKWAMIFMKGLEVSWIPYRQAFRRRPPESNPAGGDLIDRQAGNGSSPQRPWGNSLEDRSRASHLPAAILIQTQKILSRANFHGSALTESCLGIFSKVSGSSASYIFLRFGSVDPPQPKTDDDDKHAKDPNQNWPGRN